MELVKNKIYTLEIETDEIEIGSMKEEAVFIGEDDTEVAFCIIGLGGLTNYYQNRRIHKFVNGLTLKFLEEVGVEDEEIDEAVVIYYKTEVADEFETCLGFKVKIIS